MTATEGDLAGRSASIPPGYHFARPIPANELELAAAAARTVQDLHAILDSDTDTPYRRAQSVAIHATVLDDELIERISAISSSLLATMARFWPIDGIKPVPLMDWAVNELVRPNRASRRSKSADSRRLRPSATSQHRRADAISALQSLAAQGRISWSGTVAQRLIQPINGPLTTEAPWKSQARYDINNILVLIDDLGEAELLELAAWSISEQNLAAIAEHPGSTPAVWERIMEGEPSVPVAVALARSASARASIVNERIRAYCLSAATDHPSHTYWIVDELVQHSPKSELDDVLTDIASQLPESLVTALTALNDEQCRHVGAAALGLLCTHSDAQVRQFAITKLVPVAGPVPYQSGVAGRPIVVNSGARRVLK